MELHGVVGNFHGDLENFGEGREWQGRKKFNDFCGSWVKWVEELLGTSGKFGEIGEIS